MPNLEALLVTSPSAGASHTNESMSGTLPTVPPPQQQQPQLPNPSVSFAPPTISTHEPRSPTKSRNPSIARTASDINGTKSGSTSGRPSPSRSPSRVAMPEGVPNFKYRDDYSPQLPPLNRSNLNPAEDEEIELGLHAADDEEISAELRELYNSFQVRLLTIPKVCCLYADPCICYPLDMH